MSLGEYLPRLGQISVTIEIPNGHNALKRLALEDSHLILETVKKDSAENADLSLSKPGSRQVIKVPLPIDDKKRLIGAKATKIAIEDSTIHITLLLENSHQKMAVTPFTGLTNSNGVWSVDDLLKKTPRNKQNVSQFQFTCAGCDSIILDSNLHKFVDMPLEYWHEMMDFWHCHKPHEDHHDINDKNYNGKLNPKPGFVHVGTYYILVPLRSETCDLCGHTLGKTDGALKINKWDLHLQYAGKTETYQPYTFVYFALLDRVNASGVRKFTVRLAGSALAYNVWVTSVGLDVSLNNKFLKQCLKLLYVKQEDAKDDDVLEIPAEVWQSLELYFADINALLPRTTQRVDIKDGDIYRNYNVCYLAPHHEIV
ncbi:HECT-like Ubiquitin-conjugating enzyme (E2)-binding [Metschnikowia aff. pulcherrima]|uniref:HECT-like Ubiquitin-conjugating enzyme (E2)-binding n=1 Tax=Metschnikowia aff. pulcherrima TaxID=2163413 RepID=A0A4P6XTX0_9ASCO|nr:HECT-like Ubiquitin-conjugating enzyme (E2)-binding [Metschnikowia aff. pulcherrima]